MTKTSLFTLSIFITALLCSRDLHGQCSSNAGSNFSTCSKGAFNLDGSYTALSFELEQYDGSWCLALSYQNTNNNAQSFTATSNTICGAGIKFENSAFGNVNLSLYTDLPNFGGTYLAGGTVYVNHETWADVTWPEVSINVGQVYYLVITTPFPFPMLSNAPNEEACFAGSTLNPYSGGMCYSNEGYMPFPDFDFTFRTHSCQNSVSIEWFGTNIISGVNTLTPSINPPAGEHTYIMEITNNANGCFSSSSVTVMRESFSIVVEDQGDLTIIAGDAESYQWVTCPEFTPIDGVNGATYIANENGSFAVIATGSNGCIDTSSCVTINYANLDNWLDNSIVEIFPNPTSDLLTINFNGAIAQIELLDLHGKLIRRQEIMNGHAFSIESENPGIYFLRLHTKNSYTQHIVIKH